MLMKLATGGQQEALDDFNTGRSNVLVATSVLEEGLDIESCEMVIIFSQSLNLIRYKKVDLICSEIYKL